MEVIPPIPWLSDLEMDEFLLFQDPYAVNSLDDFMLHNIENVAEPGHNLNHHVSLCSSTESNSNAAVQQPATVMTTVKSKPSNKQLAKVQNKTTNTPTTKNSCFPVVLNFGSTLLSKDNEEPQQECASSFNGLQLMEDNDQVEQEDEFLYVNHEDVINEEPPAKRKYNKRSTSTSSTREHILAERRRREKLSQRFAALSALIPGLKRMDKITIIAEAIKRLNQLQEKVKALEEETAGRSVESVMILKKNQFASAEEEANSCCQIHSTTQRHQQLPEIEAKMSKNNLLVKITCEKREAILIRILGAIEKHHLSVTSVNSSPFGDTTLNVAIIAQMEKEFEIRLHTMLQDLSLACREC